MARSIDRGNQFSPPPRPLFLRPPLLARLEIELGSDRERMRQERLSFFMSRCSSLYFFRSIQLVSSIASFSTPPRHRSVPRESRRRRSRLVSNVYDSGCFIIAPCRSLFLPSGSSRGVFLLLFFLLFGREEQKQGQYYVRRVILHHGAALTTTTRSLL